MVGGVSKGRFEPTDWKSIRERWKSGPFVKICVSVEEIDGECPYYSLGEENVIIWRDSAVDLKASKDPMCGYAFASMFPILVAMGFGIDAKTIGLEKFDGSPRVGYVNCIDPGRATKKYGGRVVFKLVAHPLEED